MREMMHLWPADEAAALLAAPLPGHGECCAELAGPDVPAEAFALDYLAKTFMVGAILRKVDRMSMGNSLEVRVPLLDRRIVEFALTVPMGLKRREGVGKHLLRSVGRERLPEVVYRHPKQGFTPPLAEWFNQAFWDCYEDLAASAGMRSLFRPGALAHIAREGRAARAQEATVGHDTAAARAWIIAQLGCWLQRFRVGI
jgi:asparagine synthase (glutamine-hydrolysing)